MKQVEGARVFGVARKTIWQWLKLYAILGDSGLVARKRGPKGGGKLKGWQAAAICNLIRDRHPEQLKLPFVLWTSEAVQRLIARRFGVKLSARSVRRYLQRWGFTPQKPVRRAYERDPVAVRRWLEHQYPAIRGRCKLEKAKLYWGGRDGGPFGSPGGPVVCAERENSDMLRDRQPFRSERPFSDYQPRRSGVYGVQEAI